MLAQSNKEYSLLLVIGRLQPGRLQKRKESCDKFEANRFSDNLRRNRLRRKIKLVTSQSISLTQLSIIRVCGELNNSIVFNGLGKLFQFWFSFQNSLEQLWLDCIGGARLPCECVCFQTRRRIMFLILIKIFNCLGLCHVNWDSWDQFSQCKCIQLIHVPLLLWKKEIPLCLKSIYFH